MNRRKELTGTVISDKMTKTVVVRLTHMKKHPKYSKVVKVTKKYKVHDEKGVSKAGDLVRIIECRPISKDKHFRLKSILKKAHRHAELKEEV